MKTTRWVASLAVLGLALSGCTNESAKTLQFEIPASYFEVPAAQLMAVEDFWNLQQPDIKVLEQSAWSSSDRVTADDIFTAVAPQVPQIYYLQREIPAVELAALQQTPDSFKDLVIPVSLSATADGLNIKRNEITNAGNQLTLEQELSWDFQGTTQTMRLLAVVDFDLSRTELVWLRCSDTCMFDYEEAVQAFWDSAIVQESQ